jgi:hypothetical protein
MKKNIIFILMTISLFTFGILLTGCNIYTDTSTVYDFGLTGSWASNLFGSNTEIRVVNQIGSGKKITSIDYYIGDTEPSNWSSQGTSIGSFSQLSYTASDYYNIGTGLDIDTPVTSAATIWLKVSSDSDYLIGSFYFDPSASPNWDLTVYAKK